MGMREDFEAFMGSANYPLKRLGEGYRSSVTQIAWAAYQAAGLAAAEKVKEEAARVCDDNYWEDHRLFADAIRAIDVKTILEGK